MMIRCTAARKQPQSRSQRWHRRVQSRLWQRLHVEPCCWLLHRPRRRLHVRREMRRHAPMPCLGVHRRVHGGWCRRLGGAMWGHRRRHHRRRRRLHRCRDRRPHLPPARRRPQRGPHQRRAVDLPDPRRPPPPSAASPPPRRRRPHRRPQARLRLHPHDARRPQAHPAGRPSGPGQAGCGRQLPLLVWQPCVPRKQRGPWPTAC